MGRYPSLCLPKHSRCEIAQHCFSQQSLARPFLTTDHKVDIYNQLSRVYNLSGVRLEETKRRKKKSTVTEVKIDGKVSYGRMG